MVLQIEIKLTGKCDRCLKCEKLLQRATGAINCENYHKVRYSRGIHKVLLGKIMISTLYCYICAIN